jgi:hypothetical protein
MRFANSITAQVWLTWESVLKEGCGVEAWQWMNIYGYRVPMSEGVDEAGVWEYAVSDQEIVQLLKRCPKFFEL